MQVIDNVESITVDDHPDQVPGSPLTGHRRSLVRNIQVESTIVNDEHAHTHAHEKLTCASFFSSTLHCLGIIFGDM